MTVRNFVFFVVEFLSVSFSALCRLHVDICPVKWKTHFLCNIRNAFFNVCEKCKKSLKCIFQMMLFLDFIFSCFKMFYHLLKSNHLKIWWIWVYLVKIKAYNPTVLSTKQGNTDRNGYSMSLRPKHGWQLYLCKNDYILTLLFIIHEWH